jgi:hypothetical protein
MYIKTCCCIAMNRLITSRRLGFYMSNCDFFVIGAQGRILYLNSLYEAGTDIQSFGMENDREGNHGVGAPPFKDLLCSWHGVGGIYLLYGQRWNCKWPVVWEK